MKTNNKLLCYTNNENIKKYLNEFKTNEKNYNLINDALSALGNFNGPVEIELYDFISTEDETTIRVMCSDLLENMFVFNIYSTEKRQLKLLVLLHDNIVTKYDLSIIKNNNITNDNIDLCKSDIELNTKYGRIFTDKKSYYNILTIQDIIINVNGYFENTENELINQINKLDNKPTLGKILNILNNISTIDKDTCNIESIKIFNKDDILVNKLNFDKTNVRIRK